MAIQPGPQFDEHLPLFMNAKELLATVSLPEAEALSDKPEETTEQLLARKVSEAKGEKYIYDPEATMYEGDIPGESLYDQIKREGIKHPLNIYVDRENKEKVLFDGHHRLAVMNDIDPEAYFPVNRANEDHDDD